MKNLYKLIIALLAPAFFVGCAEEGPHELGKLEATVKIISLTSTRAVLDISVPSTPGNLVSTEEYYSSAFKLFSEDGQYGDVGYKDENGYYTFKYLTPNTTYALTVDFCADIIADGLPCQVGNFTLKTPALGDFSQDPPQMSMEAAFGGSAIVKIVYPYGIESNDSEWQISTDPNFSSSFIITAGKNEYGYIEKSIEDRYVEVGCLKKLNEGVPYYVSIKGKFSYQGTELTGMGDLKIPSTFTIPASTTLSKIGEFDMDVSFPYYKECTATFRGTLPQSLKFVDGLDYRLLYSTSPDFSNAVISDISLDYYWNYVDYKFYTLPYNTTYYVRIEGCFMLTRVLGDRSDTPQEGNEYRTGYLDSNPASFTTPDANDDEY